MYTEAASFSLLTVNSEIIKLSQQPTSTLPLLSIIYTYRSFLRFRPIYRRSQNSSRTASSYRHIGHCHKCTRRLCISLTKEDAR